MPPDSELQVLAAKIAITQLGLLIVGTIALLGNVAQILSYFRRPKTIREELAEVDRTIRQCLGDYVRRDAMDKLESVMNERLGKIAGASVRRVELEAWDKRMTAMEQRHEGLAKEIREDLKNLLAAVSRLEGKDGHD